MISSAVPEFMNYGNNTAVVPVDITLSPAADLQVTSVVVPQHILRGRVMPVSFTVTNAGGVDTPTGVSWYDQIYLSTDTLLDPTADRYVGWVRHDGVVAAGGGSYAVTTQVQLPSDLTGPFYVIVLTDPPNLQRPRGQVYEGAFENNDSTAPANPVLIDQPPASDSSSTRSACLVQRRLASRSRSPSR